MKVIWEPQDIVAGSVVGVNERKNRYIITLDTSAPSTAAWGIVDLSDGAITHKDMSRDELAEALTREGQWPNELLG